MKKLFIAVCLLLSSVAANAQRDLMLSQQFFSRLNVNPAATGNSDDIDLFMLGRWQWTNVEDSPKSGVFNASDYFEGLRSGIGFTMMYDDPASLTVRSSPRRPMPYHVNLNESLLLHGSVGRCPLSLLAGSDHTLLDPEEYGMTTFPEDDNHIYPDFDLGFELASPKLLVGGSISHLTYNEEDVTTAKPGRHFYTYVRGLFAAGLSLDLAPAIVYVHRNKVDKIELNLTGFYARMFWAALFYRPDIHADWSSNDLTFNLGMEYNDSVSAMPLSGVWVMSARFPTILTNFCSLTAFLSLRRRST